MVITSKLALKLFVVFILAKEIYDNRNKIHISENRNRNNDDGKTYLSLQISLFWSSWWVSTKNFIFSENVFVQTCNHAIEFEMSCCVLKTIYKMISNYPSFILVVNRWLKCNDFLECSKICNWHSPNKKMVI